MGVSWGADDACVMRAPKHATGGVARSSVLCLVCGAWGGNGFGATSRGFDRSARGSCRLGVSSPQGVWSRLVGFWSRVAVALGGPRQLPQGPGACWLALPPSVEPPRVLGTCLPPQCSEHAWRSLPAPRANVDSRAHVDPEGRSDEFHLARGAVVALAARHHLPRGGGSARGRADGGPRKKTRSGPKTKHAVGLKQNTQWA